MIERWKTRSIWDTRIDDLLIQLLCWMIPAHMEIYCGKKKEKRIYPKVYKVLTSEDKRDLDKACRNFIC